MKHRACLIHMFPWAALFPKILDRQRIYLCKDGRKFFTRKIFVLKNFPLLSWLHPDQHWDVGTFCSFQRESFHLEPKEILSSHNWHYGQTSGATCFLTVTGQKLSFSKLDSHWFPPPVQVFSGTNIHSASRPLSCDQLNLGFGVIGRGEAVWVQDSRLIHLYSAVQTPTGVANGLYNTQYMNTEQSICTAEHLYNIFTTHNSIQPWINSDCSYHSSSNICSVKLENCCYPWDSNPWSPDSTLVRL